MANLLLQVTIPAAGKVPLSAGLPGVAGGPGATVGPQPIGNIYVQLVQIQNNASHNIRYGDATVSPTRGIVLASGAPGGASNTAPPINYGIYLSDIWIAGTVGDVIDVFYIQ